jgi:hypothetical protein
MQRHRISSTDFWSNACAFADKLDSARIVNAEQSLNATPSLIYSLPKPESITRHDNQSNLEPRTAEQTAARESLITAGPLNNNPSLDFFLRGF